MVRVLFVCTGNICRSPTAEGVFRKLVRDARLHDRIEVDSAGTIAYHAGEAPDTRSCKHALHRGIDLSDLRARQVREDDFESFDHILAMDRGHLDHLRAMCPEDHLGKLRLMLDLTPGCGITDVPDPYYGGRDGFERVLDLIEGASVELLAELQGALPG